MKRKTLLFIAIIFTIAVIILGIINYKSEGFFSINFATCITLLIAIWISFVISERQTDIRKKKEILANLMASIQNMVTEKEAYIITDNTNTAFLTMRIRGIKNKLSLLKNYGSQFGLENDIKFIENKVNEYNVFIGDHIDDLSYLKKSVKELQRPLSLIDDKLYEMMLKLY